MVEMVECNEADLQRPKAQACLQRFNHLLSLGITSEPVKHVAVSIPTHVTLLCSLQCYYLCSSWRAGSKEVSAVNSKIRAVTDIL